MRVERAQPEDVPAVEALLVAAGLPLEGAAEAFEHGVVVRDGAEVLAAAAVERYGEAGLLRSVVVAPDRRGAGLGRDVVTAAEALSLDETASDWFPRLGYEVVDRELARAAVGASIEFTMACATTGVPMRRSLT